LEGPQKFAKLRNLPKYLSNKRCLSDSEIFNNGVFI